MLPMSAHRVHADWVLDARLAPAYLDMIIKESLLENRLRWIMLRDLYPVSQLAQPLVSSSGPFLPFGCTCRVLSRQYCSFTSHSIMLCTLPSHFLIAYLILHALETLWLFAYRWYRLW